MKEQADDAVAVDQGAVLEVLDEGEDEDVDEGRDEGDDHVAEQC